MTDAGSRDHERLRADEVIKLGEFTLTSERDGDAHSICLFGELDLATATAVHDELTRVEAGDAASIVLDLGGLTFIDSSGICLLLQRTRADRRLVLMRGSAAVQRALQLSALEDQLPFAD